MQLRSGQKYVASGEKRRRRELGSAPSVLPDHISALPDDLLLLILARLRCVATAVRTGVLARRWRHLWTQLHALVFPDVSLRSVRKALHALLDSPADGEVSLLDIRVACPTRRVTALLRHAALFQPDELLVAVTSVARIPYQSVDLPRFGRTTSISLSIGNGKYPAELHVPLSPAGDGECLFPSLTTLVLSGYYFEDGVAALLPHCPRLRVLRYTVRGDWPSRRGYAITVHSATLREIVVEENANVCRVDIATPMLNQLTVSCLDGGELTTVSIVAPGAEKVSWHCCSGWFTGFGSWYLETVSLMTPSCSLAPAAEPETRQLPWLLRIDARKRRGSLSLRMDHVDRLEKEVEKHQQLQVAADLSAMDLELHLTSVGHVYGGLVSHLLGMRRIRTAVRRLKLALIIPWVFWYREGCHEFCRCGSTEWRSQTVSLTKLEEVEIDGFLGKDHEFDFLEVISRCAPMLRKVNVKLPEGAGALNDARILGVFKAHPFMECCVISFDSAPLAG